MDVGSRLQSAADLGPDRTGPGLTPDAGRGPQDTPAGSSQEARSGSSWRREVTGPHLEG